MRNFQDTFKTCKQSFISAFSICRTVPLKGAAKTTLLRQRVLISYSLQQNIEPRVRKRISDANVTNVTLHPNELLTAQWFQYMVRTNLITAKNNLKKLYSKCFPSRWMNKLKIYLELHPAH